MTIILILVFCSTSLAKTKNKSNSKNNKNKPKSQVVASGVDDVNNSNFSGEMSTMSSTGSSGHWVENSGKWFYMTSDGTFAKDTWLWLDEDHDTYADLYHFDANGVMSQSTTIPINSPIIGTPMLVNIGNNGAAIDCTEIADGYIRDYSTFYGYRLPVNYSINSGYSYSSHVDHYYFQEIKSAFIEPLKKSGNCYSADVSLIVLFGHYEYDCFVHTTAKFSDICKVRSWDDKEVTSISDFLKKNEHYNYIEVYSVDANGYITDCKICGAN